MLAEAPALSAESPHSGATESDSSDGQRECTVAYAFDLLSCLATVIDQKIEAKHVDVVKYFDQLIPRLYQLVVVAAQPKIGSAGEPLFRDTRLLGLVGRVAQTLVWELDSQSVINHDVPMNPALKVSRKQAKAFAAVFDAFETGQMGGMLIDAGRGKGLASPLRVGFASSRAALADTRRHRRPLPSKTSSPSMPPMSRLSRQTPSCPRRRLRIGYRPKCIGLFTWRHPSFRYTMRW